MATISQVIDNRPLSALQIRTLILCGLVTLIDGYDMQNFGLAIPALAKDWNLQSGDFTYVVTMFMIGLGVGSAFISPLGDRLGRRPLIIFGLLLIAVTSFATTTATTLGELMLWRALTGAGIGICQANATALTAEFSPFKRRAGLMTAMGLFVAVGAMLAAMTAGALMRAYGGWPALFVVGGAAPLALALVFALSAPESVRLLLSQHKTIASDPRIATIIKRIAPEVDAATVTADPSEISKTPTMMQTLAAVVRQPYLERTLYLWALFALTSLLLYTLVNWLPALLAGAGKNPNIGMMTMQLGGIFGSLVLAWAMDRGHVIASLACGYSIAGVSALLFLTLPAQGSSWYGLVAALGIGISGGMLAVAALGAIFYPPPMRATGFGWAAAAARVGAVTGPLVVGLVLAAGVPSNRIIAWMAAPAFACVLIVISMRGAMKRL